MSEDLAPRCAKCQRRHLADLACWSGRYAARIVRQVLTIKGRACWICGCYATTADHITPRSRCGTDALDNLAPACAPCNYARGNTLNPFTPDPTPTPTGVGLSPRWRPGP